MGPVHFIQFIADPGQLAIISLSDTQYPDNETINLSEYLPTQFDSNLQPRHTKRIRDKELV